MASDPECLFCRIASGEIPSKQVHGDDTVVAFHDIAPRAPTHILLIPREHIRSAAELTDGDAPIVGHLFAVAASIARDQGIAEAGYRIVTNIGRGGGQTVDHLHLHLMGGRSMTWPPG
ncbi:MAG: histidine triad nucleotide-binding protein [Candidatus Limnocylindrales bacterium]